jgi:plastocyanin
MRRSAGSILALATTIALLGFAGCGDDNDDSGGSGGGGGDNAADTGGGSSGGTASGKRSLLKLSADPGGELKFDKSSLTTKAGKVTIALDNPSSATAPHAVEVEGNGVEEETKTIQPGQKAQVTVDLKPGTYEYYCPVDGHKDAGMEGELTVQ